MFKMESDSPMANPATENNLLRGEEVRAKLSPLAADLKRISDRLMEIMEKTEGLGVDHHQACECAVAEADHAEFLLPDSSEETPAGANAERKTGSEASEDSESEESLAILPQVLGELHRHLNQMEKGMAEMVAAGREVGELGCELLRCERALRAFIESAGSSPAPDLPHPPSREGAG